jgi:hypothetical protein
MPELWIPYGKVETLVTVQAENLGVVADPAPGISSVDGERLKELARGSAQVFVCDGAPATVEVLRMLIPLLEETQSFGLLAAAPKQIEGLVPEFKGRVTTLPPPLAKEDGGEPVYATELTGVGEKLFLGTARPDPLFGVVDSRVEAVLNWVAHARESAAGAAKGMEPSPFHKTGAYEQIESLAAGIHGARFLTVIPRGGRARDAMEDPPFDAVKNSFAKTEMSQSKGIVIGIGGRGYDDTFSSAVRGIWNAIEGVRKTGSILLVAECSEGIGSTALEMLVTGRLTGAEDRRRQKYVEGLEEVFYLNKLKDEYDLLLLSGLPETYARGKLGLTTAKGSGEAVGRVLNKVGRSGKLNVVPRASECLVTSG